ECERLIFFFQAEDGIRDFHVTGVQTCALPIYSYKRRINDKNHPRYGAVLDGVEIATPHASLGFIKAGICCLASRESRWYNDQKQIGRASCRERVEISGASRALKRKYRDAALL